MTDEAKVFQGFYRGVPISVSSASLDGGKKTVVRQYPNKDTQSVETLGLQPRKYSLEIILNDKENQDYFAYRDELLRILELKDPGVLIHPLYGRIESVVAVSYSVNENFTEFGFSTISVSFEVDDNTGIPQASGNVATQLEASNDAVQNAVNQSIKDNFNVTSAFFGNFTDAVNKVTEITDAATDATSFIGEQSDNINVVSAEIGELAGSVNSLVTNPIALADSVTGLFETINSLYATADSTLQTYQGFFGFGDSDTEIESTTAGLAEREKNNSTLNDAVNASALGYAYVAASEKDYLTTLDIDNALNGLEEQYKAILAADESVVDAATDLRELAIRVFDEKRQEARQITNVFVNRSSCRLLSFNYYGDDSLGQEIANQNSIDDVSFVSGDVQVFTA